MCLTMSKLSTFLCNRKSFVAKEKRTLQHSFYGRFQTSILAMTFLNLPLKCWIMPIGISATDGDAK